MSVATRAERVAIVFRTNRLAYCYSKVYKISLDHGRTTLPCEVYNNSFLTMLGHVKLK